VYKFFSVQVGRLNVILGFCYGCERVMNAGTDGPSAKVLSVQLSFLSASSLASLISTKSSTLLVTSFLCLKTSFIPEKDEYTKTRSQLLAEMDVSMGGRVAEELIFGVDKVTTGRALLIISF
jgi:hypothetical protein